MRILFLILFVFAVNAAAQNPFQQKLFADGVKLARNGEFEKAADDFRRILTVAEINRTPEGFLSRVHFNLGACYFRLEMTERSIAEFTKAIKFDRKYQKAHYALGMAQSKLKNAEEAEKSFRSALKLNEKDGETWFDLALVYLNRQNFDAAENAFENAVKYKSVAASDALNNLGVIYALKHDFENAEIMFEKAVFASSGNSAEAKNNLEFCKKIKGSFDRNLIAKLEIKGR